MLQAITTMARRNGTRFEVLLFALIALVLLLMNVLRLMWLNFDGRALIIGFELFFSLALFLAGRFTFLGGVLYIIFYAISNCVPFLSVPTTFLYLGMIPILALWIANRWYLVTVVAYVLSHLHIVFIADENMRFYLEYSVLELSLALIVGLGIRLNAKKVESLQLNLVSAQQQIENQEREIRQELSAELHDHIAKDLALMSIIAQERVLSTSGSETPRDWSYIVVLSQQASASLRSLISGMKEKVTPETIRNIIEQNKILLKQRRFQVLFTFNYDDITVLDTGQLKLLALLLREGFMNIFKYSSLKSKVQFSLHLDQAGSLYVLLSNEINAKTSVSPSLTSNFGLNNLYRVFEKEKASIVATKAENTWILSALIPAYSQIDRRRNGIDTND
ncbi:hypothetical protein HHJ78_02385 [Mobiluncus mulieris]|uniref:Signal transduction histidine kinase subgroup 3 dimerisation and phosphoacceptor domain-containing protein n=1 Tax=Mobiluncus mulieris TaxID=2052 RepID=A0A7Y0U016_9ACTO|nr:hypothetical protein [Mobiluncus mulieris]NMW64404.1 hypothetical protein [Mobiluncus mulieris]